MVDVDKLFLELVEPSNDGKSDMEENANVNEAEGDEEYIIGKDCKIMVEERKDRKMTKEEKKVAGFFS